jgi:23S rRNA pseudouridine955/2504/2580 synthase
MLREGEVSKRYLAIVKGILAKNAVEMRESLHKYVTASGERRVSVHEDGRSAVTRVRPLKATADYSVLEVELLTGRTHQIRVHLAHAGHPILGDDKYGDFALNHDLAKRGVKRLFLHAARLAFKHPASGEEVQLESPLPPDMRAFVEQAFA